MGRKLRKVKPGMKLSGNLSAGTINALIDDHDRLAEVERRLGEFREQLGPRAGIVPIKNVAVSAMSQYDIVGLDDILFSPSDNLLEFKNNFAFKGAIPTAVHKAALRFGVLMEPIEAGTDRIVSVVVDGLTVARLNIVDAAHTRANVSVGESTQFVTDDNGPVNILWKESGTGTSKWGVVRLVCCSAGAGRRLRGLLCGDLETGDGTINLRPETVIDRDSGEHVCLGVPPDNALGMSGQDGNLIYLEWDVTLTNYVGTQAQHKEQCATRTVYEDGNHKCLAYSVLKFGAMYATSGIPVAGCHIIGIGPCVPPASGALECDLLLEWSEVVCCGSFLEPVPCNSSGSC